MWVVRTIAGEVARQETHLQAAERRVDAWEQAEARLLAALGRQAASNVAGAEASHPE